jgi:hypothetical protein
MIIATIKVTDTDSIILKNINNLWIQVLQRKFPAIALKCENKLKQLIEIGIKSSSEYQSITTGDLRGQLGLPNAEEALNNIINSLVNDITVETKISASLSNLRANLIIRAINMDWSQVLSLATSRYTTDKGRLIPWLEWMIFLGDIIIVKDFEVSEDIKPGEKSRTGDAVMVKSGSGWRIPPDYSGTVYDNFITRAVDKIAPDFERYFREEILK